MFRGIVLADNDEDNYFSYNIKGLKNIFINDNSHSLKVKDEFIGNYYSIRIADLTVGDRQYYLECQQYKNWFSNLRIYQLGEKVVENIEEKARVKKSFYQEINREYKKMLSLIGRGEYKNNTACFYIKSELIGIGISLELSYFPLKEESTLLFNVSF